MAHLLPSATHLSDFTAHFKRAVFTRDGGADVMFALAPEQLDALLDLQRNDGMALNISVWATELGDGSEGDGADGAGGLAGLLGMLEGLSDEGGEGGG